MNAAKNAQKGTQTDPTTFLGMDRGRAHSIAIARPFFLSVADGEARTLKSIVAVILIGIDRGFGLGEVFHESTQRFPLSVGHDT